MSTSMTANPQTMTPATARLQRLLRFPLLGKELLEQAARRRTWVLRVVAAVGLYWYGGAVLNDWGDRDIWNLLGQGAQIFYALVASAFAAVFLLLPALLAGVIADERQRGTLALLVLTQLSPWRIVLEKLGSRLLPTVLYVLLILPLGAAAYAYGGFGQDEIWLAALGLLVTMLQVGAVALWMSSISRTATVALVRSYVVLLLMYVVPWFLLLLLALLMDDVVGQHVQAAYMLATPLNPVACYVMVGFSNGTVLWFLPSVGVAGLMLLLTAREVGQAAPINRAIAGSAAKSFGQSGAARQRTLPDDQPLRWLARHSSQLTFRGRPVRHAVAALWSLGLFAGLLLLIALFNRPDRADWVQIGFIFMSLCLITLAILGLLRGVGVAAGDRQRQTLDLLLVTPMPGSELVKQRVRGTAAPVDLLLQVVIAALICWVVFDPHGSLRGQQTWRGYTGIDNPAAAYQLLILLGVTFIYYPLVTWTSVLLGLKCRTGNQALMLTLMLFMGWLLSDALVDMIFRELTGEHRPWIGTSWPVGPLGLLQLLDDASDLPLSPWLVLELHLGGYLLLALLLRYYVLSRADRLLRRV